MSDAEAADTSTEKVAKCVHTEKRLLPRMALWLSGYALGGGGGGGVFSIIVLWCYY